MAYDLSFANEVYEKSEMGHWIKMCMQCGVCAGSCPLGPHWEFSPRQLFQMVRAGKREEVLTSESMWMCTSCYNCIVRCPRELPITHIVHGLARFAVEQGKADDNQVTRRFAKILWDNLTATGRIGEMSLSMKLYFADGLAQGIKNSLEMQAVALGMFTAGKLKVDPLHMTGKIKDFAGLTAILDKARELEAKKKES